MITFDSRSVRDRVLVMADRFGAKDHAEVSAFMRARGVEERVGCAGLSVWTTDHELAAILQYRLRERT